MGDSDEKCCLCFPLECGVKALAVLTIFGTIFTAYTAYVIEGGWASYGVIVACSAVMSLVFIFALASPSEQSRKIAFLTWIIAIVVVMRVWYTYVLLNGSVWDIMCHQETVDAINEAGITEQITTEECEMGGKTYFWTDHIVGWILEIYFATVIKRWSQNDEGYDAQ